MTELVTCLWYDHGEAKKAAEARYAQALGKMLLGMPFVELVQMFVRYVPPHRDGCIPK